MQESISFFSVELFFRLRPYLFGVVVVVVVVVLIESA